MSMAAKGAESGAAAKTEAKRGAKQPVEAEAKRRVKQPMAVEAKQQAEPSAETALAFIEHNLQIQDKAGRLVPLIFNPAQLRLYQEIERQQAAGRPVRIIILKARQVGFSTAVAALFYERSARHANTNSMIVAHKAEASANIFSKAKLFYETSPPSCRPMKRASNARELLFENPSNKQAERDADPGLRSKIRIETAGAKDAGRSATIHNLHLSELAFWPHAEETMLSLMQAVPHDPNTMVIIESTANGVGGEFHRQWLRAVRGESEFVPLFFPWWEHREYRLEANLPAGQAAYSVGKGAGSLGREEGQDSRRSGQGSSGSGQDIGIGNQGGSNSTQDGSSGGQDNNGSSDCCGQAAGDNGAPSMDGDRAGSQEQWNDEEVALQEDYGLDEAQLRWRRWCISANCGGDPDRFTQEYPASADEAFLASGRPVFASRALAKAYAAAGEPLARGELEWGKGGITGATVKLRQERRGRLAIYEQPSALGDYWIGVDASSGMAGGDYSAMAVVEKKSLLPVAFWQGRIDPDLLGEEAVKLASYYQQAMIAPELNNQGIAVVNTIRRLHWPRLYRRRSVNRTEELLSCEYGFQTTLRTKPLIINNLARYIREDALRIPDRETIAECISYMHDEHGGTNAQAGSHDDRVMALAIALWVAGETRRKGKPFIEEDWRELYGANEHTGY